MVLCVLQTQYVCPYPDGTGVYSLESLGFWKHLQTSAKNISRQPTVITGILHMFNLEGVGLVIQEQCT